jgi:mannitol-specific phosphotransferase system IIBC component
MNTTNDILKEIKNQAKDSINELTEKFTKDLDETAREYGAIKREREIRDAKLLLQALFVYATSSMSQKILAVCAAAMGAGDISDQAWQKKFTMRSVANISIGRHIDKSCARGQNIV